MFSASDIKALREKTGAGMLDCKNALEANNGDMDKAAAWLREKGMAAAAKKEGRIAAEGIVDSYIHMGGKIGVLLEVNCETDFVAKNPAFRELAHNIALQIAASKPLFVSVEDVDQKTLEEEKKIYFAQAKNEGKPDQVAEKIVEGKVKKYYQEVCLLEQPYFREPEKKIREVINEAVLSIGEKITRSVNGSNQVILLKRSSDEIKQIKRYLRSTVGKNLLNRDVKWYDGEKIHWDPFVTNLVHTTDNPSEACLHFLIAYPEHQLMTRFMYPNYKLEKESSHERI